MSAEQNERFSKRFWASVYVQSTPSNILPGAIGEPTVEELSGQDAAVLGLGPDAVGPPAIRCFLCGSAEPMATHRCDGRVPHLSGQAVLPESSKPIPSESTRPSPVEEPPEECDVCHTAFGPDGEFRRMMVVRDSAPRRPSSRSPLLMEDEWNLAVCEPCHEQFEAWLFRDMSELDTLRPPPPPATEHLPCRLCGDPLDADHPKGPCVPCHELPPTERELEP